MSDHDSEAAAFCAGQVRAHDFDRYAATLFAPPERRRSLLALYAFNVEIVRVRDQVSQPLPGEIRLQWWRDMLEGVGHGGVEGNPVASELMHAIRVHHLPAARLAQLASEHQFDLYNDPMPTMAALEGYLGDTGSVLFDLAARILGASTDAVEHAARHAGLAQGIAAIMTALPRDASRRQSFVPQQLLDRHGCALEDVFAGKDTPALRAALAALITEARGHLDTALRLLADTPAAVRPAFLPLALVSGDLDALGRADDPFRIEPRSRLRTLWTLWRASKGRVFRN